MSQLLLLGTHSRIGLPARAALTSLQTERSSPMPSSSWRVLGRGSVLGNLRSDFGNAIREITIVGPWIDDYFAAFVCGLVSPTVSLRILTRSPSASDSGFVPHAHAAASIFRKH